MLTFLGLFHYYDKGTRRIINQSGYPINLSGCISTNFILIKVRLNILTTYLQLYVILLKFY